MYTIVVIIRQIGAADLYIGRFRVLWQTSEMKT